MATTTPREATVQLTCCAGYVQLATGNDYHEKGCAQGQRVGSVTLDGVGQNAPLETNAQGGRQSASPYRFDLFPPFAEAEVAKVLAKGAAKYTPWNWTLIPSGDHLNHARQHIVAFIAGDRSEEGGDPMEHARHAACRIMMWLDMLVRESQGAK